ncbi:MAG: YceI family protein [Betaproteobacteria bacterium]|nr:YceI family protein [Betaproteobacteria bacterium]
MKAVLWLCGLFWSVVASSAPVTVVDHAKSEIKFVSKQMNVPVEGDFKKFQVQFVFDPDKLASSKASINVEMASIDTGSSEGDAEVQRKPWFNTKEHPRATFQSSSVKALGGGKYEVGGKLMIKGRSKDVAVPFTARKVTDGTLLEGAFSMNRKDFGIGEGAWDDPETVAYEVQIKFKFLGKSK